MKDKIYLGDTTGHGKLYLSEHSWDCRWYWGFGYIGNKNCHFHMSSLIGAECLVDKVFDKGTKITQAQWWVIRDLFIQAYALKQAAEIYRFGGSQTTKKGITDCIKNADMVVKINQDLEVVLNTAWEFITKEVES